MRRLLPVQPTSSLRAFYGFGSSRRSETILARDIIVAVETRLSGAAPRVTVLPITSQQPRSGTAAVEVPNDLKVRIRVDPARAAWVVVDEANVFSWPGYDLVPLPDGAFVRGVITSGFFQKIAAAVLAVRAGSRLRRTDRDDP